VIHLLRHRKRFGLLMSSREKTKNREFNQTRQKARKMASETFEQRMERACKDKEIPGAIMVADDNEGMLC